MPELPTSLPEAMTKDYGLDSIHKKTQLNLRVLQGQTEQTRIEYMRSVFKRIQAAGGKMKVVERDAQGTRDKTDVVFRQLDSRGELSGKSGIRLSHGTEVQLAQNARYIIGNGIDKHVYIKVSYNGKEGYVAAEYLNANIDNTIVKKEPKLPVNPPVETGPTKEPKLPVNPPVETGPTKEPKLPVNPPVETGPTKEPKLPVNPPVETGPTKNEKEVPRNPRTETAPTTDTKESTPESPTVQLIQIDKQIIYKDFATQYDTTPEELNRINGLNLAENVLLEINSELYIPTASQKSPEINRGTEQEQKNTAEIAARKAQQTKESQEKILQNLKILANKAGKVADVATEKVKDAAQWAGAGLGKLSDDFTQLRAKNDAKKAQERDAKWQAGWKKQTSIPAEQNVGPILTPLATPNEDALFRMAPTVPGEDPRIRSKEIADNMSQPMLKQQFIEKMGGVDAMKYILFSASVGKKISVPLGDEEIFGEILQDYKDNKDQVPAYIATGTPGTHSSKEKTTDTQPEKGAGVKTNTPPQSTPEKSPTLKFDLSSTFKTLKNLTPEQQKEIQSLVEGQGKFLITKIGDMELNFKDFEFNGNTLKHSSYGEMTIQNMQRSGKKLTITIIRGSTPSAIVFYPPLG